MAVIHPAFKGSPAVFESLEIPANTAENWWKFWRTRFETLAWTRYMYGDDPIVRPENVARYMEKWTRDTQRRFFPFKTFIPLPPFV